MRDGIAAVYRDIGAAGNIGSFRSAADGRARKLYHYLMRCGICNRLVYKFGSIYFGKDDIFAYHIFLLSLYKAFFSYIFSGALSKIRLRPVFKTDSTALTNIRRVNVTLSLSPRMRLLT